MLILTSDQIRSLAPIPELIEALRIEFGHSAIAHPRQVLSVPGGAGDRQLLCMPSFSQQGGGMVKLSTVYPDNPVRDKPTIQGVIVVFDADGAPAAILDGGTVTKLRTGAASALASSFLSREDSSHLAILGTGALAPFMAQAHCAVRPIKDICVWGRDVRNSEATAAHIRELVDPGIHVHTAESAEHAAANADIVSCATSATAPVLAGRWLRSGTFVDLVGSFSPNKRESDDDVVRGLRIFVDTFEGTLAEAGDLLDPLRRGVIDRDRIEGELADLVRHVVKGRRDAHEIIVFKSVGTALEDLAAAKLILANATRRKA